MWYLHIIVFLCLSITPQRCMDVKCYALLSLGVVWVVLSVHTLAILLPGKDHTACIAIWVGSVPQLVWTWLQREQDRKCTYKRNIEAHSHNHCYRGKAVLHILNVCVALVIQHATHMCQYYTVICGLSGSIKFFHSISWRHDFQKNVIEHNACVLFSLQFLSKHFPFWEELS
jgi:hypothetical protein